VLKLEEQLQHLAALGIVLSEGVTIADLLYSFEREAYEEQPYALILFALGMEVEREPWGRSVCHSVWNFDTECINSSGDYTKIVKRLCSLAGNPNYLAGIKDSLNLASGEGVLEYAVEGKQRKWQLELNDDWADVITLTNVMADIQRGGNRFYFKDNGQAMIIFYLSQLAATEINNLSGDALKPLIQE